MVTRSVCVGTAATIANAQQKPNGTSDAHRNTITIYESSSSSGNSSSNTSGRSQKKNRNIFCCNNAEKAA